VFDYFRARPGATPLSVLPAANPQAALIVPAGQGQPSAPAAAHAIQHLLVVPQLPGGWWLYGEAGKVVPMSKQRVSALALLQDGFAATLTVVAGERVQMLVAAGADGVLNSVLCTAAPTATLTCTQGACACA
jgi:hypothetical protein